MKTEVWKRVVGYFAPTCRTNKGKQEEMRLRKTYKTFNNVPVKKLKEEEK